MTDEWGGYWTEAKLDVLRKYTSAFTTASRRAGSTVYLDLFAGALANTRPDTGAEYEGSTSLAMKNEPPFTRLVFCELDGPAAKLRADLASSFPGDSRYIVVAGDCNIHLAEGLQHVSDLRWAPTFAFIDPKGLEVEWSTLSQLAAWRKERKNRKVELWILLPEPALSRVLGLKGVKGESSADRLTALYGCDDWIAIHQRRRSGEFTPQQTRAEFVNLLRWRLEQVLGYRFTHALQLHNVNNQPMYTMVFATDEKVGNGIMRDIHDHALVHEIPTMRAHAKGTRRKKKESALGVQRLFDPGETPDQSEGYLYVVPWEPPEKLDEEVVLDEEPPADSEPD